MWTSPPTPDVSLRRRETTRRANGVTSSAEKQSAIFPLAARARSSSGQEPDGTDEYQADSPYEVEIEPALGEEFQTEPVMDEKRNHAAGGDHRERMHKRDQNRGRQVSAPSGWMTPDGLYQALRWSIGQDRSAAASDPLRGRLRLRTTRAQAAWVGSGRAHAGAAG